jgi:hypothetical protein
VIKAGSIYLITLYGEIYHYDSIVSFYHSITDSFSYLTNFNFGSRPMNPLIINTYDLYTSMQDISLKINSVFEVNNFSVDYTRLIGFPHMDHLLQLHSNLDKYHDIHRIISVLIAPFILIVGVNIHYIVGVIVNIFNAFNKFFNSLINRCASSLYDPIRDTYFYYDKNPTSNSSTSKNNSNNGQNNDKKRKRENSGSDGEDPNQNNNKKPNSKDKVNTAITIRQIAEILKYIRARILESRQNGDRNGPRVRWYGRGANDTVVSLRQIALYVAVNPHVICPLASLPLSVILSEDTLELVRLGRTLDNIASHMSLYPFTGHHYFTFYTELGDFVVDFWNSHSYGPMMPYNNWSGRIFNISDEFLEQLSLYRLLEQ